MNTLINEIINIPQNLFSQSTTTEPSDTPDWLMRLVNDMISHVLKGTIVDESFLHSVINFLSADPGSKGAKDPTSLGSQNPDNLRSHEPVSLRPHEPSNLRPHDPATPPYKSFIDGLRKYGNTDLPDPDLQDDDKDLNGLIYDDLDGSLFISGVSENDIRQGQVGDCYFLAALSAVANTHPEFIEKSITKNVDNTYTVNFYNISLSDNRIYYDQAGAYRQSVRTTSKVNIDADIPQIGNMNLYGSGQTANELWVPLYEKAYAVLKENDYDGIHGGDPAEAISDLVGIEATHYRHSSHSEGTLLREMLEAVNNNMPMVAASPPSPDGSYTSPQGIVYNHAYTVLDVFTKNDVQYVKLRNPYGYLEWNGDGSDSTDDGVFTMPFSSYKEIFYDTSILEADKYDGLFDVFSNPRKRF